MVLYAMWTFLQVATAASLIFGAFRAPDLATYLGLEPAAQGAFTGALLAAAFAMLGLLLNRLATGAADRKFEAARAKKIRALITAELVNAASGYLQSARLLIAANKMSYDGRVPPLVLAEHSPRRTPMTEALRTDLCLLTSREIDAITTLLGNLAETRDLIHRLGDGPKTAGDLDLLSQMTADDMRLLAQTFAVIAPTRKLRFEPYPTDKASETLKRQADSLNSRS